MDGKSPRHVPLQGKRRRTRDRIAETAIALFQEQGFQSTTMEQIAAAADVVRGTLYNHFPVKEAIVVHWLDGQLAQAIGPLMEETLARPTFMARAAVMLEAAATWWEQHRELASPYVRQRFQEVQDGMGDEPTSEIIPAYARIIAEGQAFGELSSLFDADRLASHLHFLTLGALLDWVGNPRVTLSDRHAEVLEFFMEGARSRDLPPARTAATRRTTRG